MAQAMSFSEKGEKMELSQLKIPTHVSIIMDGNGRWAKSKGMPRTYGHSKGADVLMDICEDADALGIKYLTVYAFSTENWSRPETEVKNADVFVSQIYQNLLWEGNEKQYSCACHRR